VHLRYPADIGHALRAERLAQRKTQAELAAAAGVSRRWLAAVEKGHQAAEIGLVLTVFRRLGFDIVPSRRPRPSPAAQEVFARLSRPDAAEPDG